MSINHWWEVSIVVPAEAAEAVATAIGAAFGVLPVQHYRPNAESATVTAYVNAPTPPSTKQQAALRAEIHALIHAKADKPSPRLRVSRLKNTNWCETWKRHFRPIEFGRVLLIKPTWSRRKPKRGQAAVVLDPGFAFGTGHHPTTKYCLEEIVRFHRAAESLSFFDIGTGSGILAIAAAKLGYNPVRAIDIDPDAIKRAIANARRNRVHHRIDFSAVGLKQLDAACLPQHNMVCANLSDDVLVSECSKIRASVVPGGFLVVAGILREAFPRVQSCYENLGLRLLRTKTDCGWRSGTFALQPQ